MSLSLLASCSTVPFLSGNDGAGEEDGPCPARRAAPAVLPGVQQEERTLAYWLGRTADPDEVILSAEAIGHHNAAFRALAKKHPDDDPLTFVDLAVPEDRARLTEELRERLGYMRERIEDGRYVAENGEPLDEDERRPFAAPGELPALVEELRVVLAPIALRCGPRAAPIYSAPVDKRFDRNSCSTLRPQEPVRVIAAWPGGTKLVRSGYALGWIAGDAPLSPPVAAEHREALLRGPHLRVSGSVELDGVDEPVELPERTLVAAAGSDRALVATAAGLRQSKPLPRDRMVSVRRPVTRRALLTEAFSYLDTPYGWGGQDGGRDCSRFVMDVMASFGLELPRHSGLQAQAGSFRVDLEKIEPESDRLALIDAAHERGIVLLHFPGHIMLYLGKNAGGRPMVMHAFAEYLESCSAEDAKASGRSETLFTVDRVQVSDLSLGEGTTRTSFLERLTHITVLGDSPGQALLGLAARRPGAPLDEAPERCEDGDEVAMLVSPRTPHPGAPLRVVVSSSRDLGSVTIALEGPHRERHEPEIRKLGGPPFGYWVELPSPEPGKWTAMVGEGARVEACTRLTVRERGDGRQAAGGHVWVPRRRWDRGTENLFSTFVEQLFDHPFDDRTWPSLQKLIDDRDRNILHGHLGQNEERRLHLEPDCADLPYFLRAYFAWKMRLPFAYRHCNRGRSGKAPYCDRELHDHLIRPEGKDEVAGFADFVRRRVGDGVHSGTGRTAPDDDHTDYYPIPLTREAIRPGVMYADPYGHLFVIADWIPQGASGHGVLVGADAQPDGTVGRRRFWRGSFLFTPDTSEAGAGFKAFRPVVYRGGRIRPVDNEDIASMKGMTPFSMEQYRGSADDFYDRVEALIHPRPLDPRQALDVLVEALHEQVKRRVVSVQNGEDYKKKNGGSIDMPDGHAIFETSGPWEDYSTPSRDMRLLIAMDTVTGFTGVVARRPERFGIEKNAVQAAVADLEKYLAGQLEERRFSYVKSDGASVELRLEDVLKRARAFEMAYNPNDCIEIRWAAPEDSPERASCRRRAPSDQLRRMVSYRPWFAERKRPAR